MRTVHPDKIYREIIWFCSGYLRKSGPEATRTIINSIFCEWASIFNDYSSPFRGWTAGTVNSVTGYGTPCRSGVWEPAESLTPEQKYWFACATFDNWEGWNEQQVQFLLKSNPRRNRAKFTISPFLALRVKQHKAVLLDELKSAREQQKRRDERADGSVPLKLSGKIHKQLESIARSRGVPPKKMLNEMIEQAHPDFVANEQQRPGVKDGRVPDYQFCSVLNKCIRPLPVRDTKIIH